MTTLSGSRLYRVWLGTPTTADEGVTILGMGPTGDPLERRRLVHPDAVNFPPILYFQNPDRTFNMDNDALRAPITQVIRALSGSVVTRFDEELADVIVTEVWTGSDEKFAMPGFQFRQLYEYVINPPAWVPSNPVYVQYSPQDKNAKTFNVELLRLAVGAGGDPTQLYDVTEYFPAGQGGAYDPLAMLDDGFAVEGSGLIDRTVVLQMKIVSEV